MLERIYDRVEVIGYIEEEILAEGFVPYRFAREVKNHAYKDDVSYNLLLQYMGLPRRRKHLLKFIESHLKREGRL